MGISVTNKEARSDYPGAAVSKLITQHPKYKESKRIGIYLSMPAAEIQTDAIVRDAFLNGKKVFVPFLRKHPSPSPDAPKSVMDMVDLRSLSDYTSLKRDSWGIPTIGDDTVAEREGVLGYWTPKEISSEGLDMILLPGVAFDVDPADDRIRRLGHGKGYYDYFMHRYLGNQRGTDTTNVPGTDVLLYGLALEEQSLQSETGKSVPVGDLDHRLHGLVVGSGKIVEGPLNTS